MSNFNLDGFMGKYKDFARGYLFYCKILNAPAFAGLSQDHPFLVSSTKLPQQKLEETTANWQGLTYKLAVNTTYEAFTIEFKVDPKSEIRASFLKWANNIHNIETNFHGTPGEGGGYFANIALDHLDGQGNSISTYNLIGAFPTSVGDITLDYSSKDLAKLTVSFNYQYHIIGGVSARAPIPTGLVGG